MYVNVHAVIRRRVYSCICYYLLCRVVVYGYYNYCNLAGKKHRLSASDTHSNHHIYRVALDTGCTVTGSWIYYYNIYYNYIGAQSSMPYPLPCYPLNMTTNNRGHALDHWAGPDRGETSKPVFSRRFGGGCSTSGAYHLEWTEGGHGDAEGPGVKSTFRQNPPCRRGTCAFRSEGNVSGSYGLLPAGPSMLDSPPTETDKEVRTQGLTELYSPVGWSV